MFQFRAFPSYTYLIQCMILRYCLSVFPHSEISGSQLICSSPKLIAACRVLHRLLMPRHSPCALFSLTFRKCSHLRLVLLNYAGLQQKMFTKLYLPFLELTFRPVPIKKVPQCCYLCRRALSGTTPSVALLFFLLCSVFKVHLRLESVVENSGIEPLTS